LTSSFLRRIKNIENESFASTNEREGSEIASQIVRALLGKHIKVFSVTHLYDFAYSVFDQKLDSATFLRAERRPDGTLPFKLSVAEPLQTSCGENLYNAIFVDDMMGVGYLFPQH
jgi:hypothetical protein